MSFLRTLFGPRQTEVWQQFCSETGGRYISGSFWKGDARVEVPHGTWTVTLDTNVVSSL
jgi:hypothetical protein